MFLCGLTTYKEIVVCQRTAVPRALVALLVDMQIVSLIRLEFNSLDHSFLSPKSIFHFWFASTLTGGDDGAIQLFSLMMFFPKMVCVYGTVLMSCMLLLLRLALLTHYTTTYLHLVHCAPCEFCLLQHFLHICVEL